MTEIYREGYQIQEELEEVSEINFDEPVLEKDWMDNVVILQMNSGVPVETGQMIGIRAHIQTNEVPKEVAMHLYHEDMRNFFLSNGEYGFIQIASKLEKVPVMGFGDVYDIKFDLSGDDVKGTRAPYTLNAFESHTFQKAGTYFATVSMKLQNGNIVHYETLSSVTKVKGLTDTWVNESLENLINAVEEQKADTFHALAVTILGIVFSLVFVGFNFILNSTKKESYTIRKLNTINFKAMVILLLMVGLAIYLTFNTFGNAAIVNVGFLGMLIMISLHYTLPKTSISF